MYRERDIAYLGKTFALSKEDSEDVIQEVYITLVDNVHDGMLYSLSSSLYTYFPCIIAELNRPRF